MQELLRVVTQTSQAQENERKRRLAWEQEQEERHAQRQAELERQMQEMQREIYSLRSAFIAGTIPDQQSTSSQLMSPTPHHCTHPSRHVQYYSPISPIPQISDTFAQGSSSSPLQQYEHIASDTSSSYSIPMSPQYVPPLSPAPSSSARPLDSPMTSPGSVSPIGMSMLPPEKPPDNAHKGSENDCDSDRHNETRSEDSGPSRNYYQRKCRSIQVREFVDGSLYVNVTSPLRKQCVDIYYASWVWKIIRACLTVNPRGRPTILPNQFGSYGTKPQSSPCTTCAQRLLSLRT
ncbi:hypothetical protein F5050DRAFT_1135921 [Lentinula boryana]|uniref:Uncharacterized protein n=1 Tax=Lentinula boryana TaxID=40481 RepID=A0ABQ8QTS5_9AGAR|nr:hypothetical protein F5050DRAFT_1135921 [Lentinula boryana]